MARVNDAERKRLNGDPAYKTLKGETLEKIESAITLAKRLRLSESLLTIYNKIKGFVETDEIGGAYKMIADIKADSPYNKFISGFRDPLIQLFNKWEKLLK